MFTHISQPANDRSKPVTSGTIGLPGSDANFPSFSKLAGHVLVEMAEIKREECLVI